MSTDAAQTSFDIAVIGGDGIGPEVVAEGLKVLGASGVDLRTTEYDLGAARWHRTGETLPDSVVVVSVVVVSAADSVDVPLASVCPPRVRRRVRVERLRGSRSARVSRVSSGSRGGLAAAIRPAHARLCSSSMA